MMIKDSVLPEIYRFILLCQKITKKWKIFCYESSSLKSEAIAS